MVEYEVLQAVTREPITISKIARFYLFFMGGRAWSGALIPMPPASVSDYPFQVAARFISVELCFKTVVVIKLA